jgi:hypothetical protein
MYTETDRKVFRYLLTFPDGQTIPRYADPIAIRRNLLLATGGKLHKLLEDANKDIVQIDDSLREGSAEWQAAVESSRLPEDSPERLQALQARGILAQAACMAFQLPPFDSMTGEGVLEEESIAILAEYLIWLEAKKKSGGR